MNKKYFDTLQVIIEKEILTDISINGESPIEVACLQDNDSKEGFQVSFKHSVFRRDTGE